MTKEHRPARLLSVLGLGFGLAVIIGNTIGTGILRTPGEIAARVPTPALYLAIWVIGALYALLGANALAELGTMLQRSGGQYVFSREALGDYFGFVVGWSDWLSTCGSATAAALVIGESLVYLFPSIGVSERIIALVPIVFFVIVQWRGVKTAGSTQEWTSALKALVYVLLVVACFALGSGWSTGAARPSSAVTFAGVILALQAVVFTYDGWSGVIYFSEEVKNPGRDIPRSMFGGVLSVLLIYLLVNLGFLFVVPLEKLAGDKLPAGLVASTLFGQSGDVIVRLLIIATLLSAASAFQLMATRVIFGLGRDRLFTQRIVTVNAGGTPIWAHVMSAVVAAAFAVTSAFDRVIALMSFFFVANYALSFVSLFVLRARRPEAERPFRAWGHPFTTGAALLLSLGFLVSAVISDTRNSVYALVLLAVSYPLFRAMQRQT
jgi:APA family basic amino acid/polyamine antiporter